MTVRRQGIRQYRGDVHGRPDAGARQDFHGTDGVHRCGNAWLRGSTLAQVQAALQPLLDGGVIRLNAYNRNGAAQEILNATNWIVCSQSPRAGAVYKVNLEKKRTVSLSLRRPETKC